MYIYNNKHTLCFSNKALMKKFNTWQLPKQLTVHNFWTPFLLFGFIFNVIAFSLTSYYENEVWDRSMIFTYLIYCSLFGALHFYIFKSFTAFLRTTIYAFIMGASVALFSLLSLYFAYYISIIGDYVFIMLAYTTAMVLFLKTRFNVQLSKRFFAELIFMGIISLILRMQLDSINSHVFGYQFMLSAWLLNTTYIALAHNVSDTID